MKKKKRTLGTVWIKKTAIVYFNEPKNKDKYEAFELDLKPIKKKPIKKICPT